MIVGIINQTNPNGQIAVKQFREAIDEATAVSDYVNSFSPAKNPADWLGHDSGWSEVQKPSFGKRWAYDFDSPPPGPGGFIEIDSSPVIMVCAVLNFDNGADIPITQDGSWELLRRVIIDPQAVCGPDLNRFVLRPRFSYQSTGGNPQLRITEDGALFGQPHVLADNPGFTRTSFRSGGVPTAGNHTYALQGDRNGATLFELRGLVIEIAKRVD